MSVKIRLTKTGRRNQTSFRIVAIDTRAKRDGKFVENLGFYQPNASGENKFKIDKEKVKFWQSKGAKTTPAVDQLLEKGELTKTKKHKKKEAAKAQAAQSRLPASQPQDQAQEVLQNPDASALPQESVNTQPDQNTKPPVNEPSEKEKAPESETAPTQNSPQSDENETQQNEN